MNDIGFGMLDKRSVAAILFSLGLAAALGLQIPIDTANVENLFVDVVLFTGILYLYRSVFRLSVILMFFIFDKNARHIANPSFNRENMPAWVRNGSNRLSAFSWYVFDSGYFSTGKFIARFLDRVILVGIILIASEPTNRQYVYISGLVGIIIMLLIYLLRGSFSYIVRDSVDATIEDEENRANEMESLRKYKGRHGTYIRD